MIHIVENHGLNRAWLHLRPETLRFFVDLFGKGGGPVNLFVWL